MRKLLDGSEVAELPTARVLTIKTKCPAKWRLVDMETGEMYVPWDTEGKQDWKKVDPNA